MLIGSYVSFYFQSSFWKMQRAMEIAVRGIFRGLYRKNKDRSLVGILGKETILEKDSGCFLPGSLGHKREWRLKYKQACKIRLFYLNKVSYRIGFVVWSSWKGWQSSRKRVGEQKPLCPCYDEDQFYHYTKWSKVVFAEILEFKFMHCYFFASHNC